jgi:hypothetical protein
MQQGCERIGEPVTIGGFRTTRPAGAFTRRAGVMTLDSSTDSWRREEEAHAGTRGFHWLTTLSNQSRRHGCGSIYRGSTSAGRRREWTRDERASRRLSHAAALQSSSSYTAPAAPADPYLFSLHVSIIASLTPLHQLAHTYLRSIDCIYLCTWVEAFTF